MRGEKHALGKWWIIYGGGLCTGALIGGEMRYVESLRNLSYHVPVSKGYTVFFNKLKLI